MCRAVQWLDCSEYWMTKLVSFRSDYIVKVWITEDIITHMYMHMYMYVYMF